MCSQSSYLYCAHRRHILVQSLYVMLFVKEFWQELKLKLIYDRQSVDLCLGVRLPSGAHDQIFYLSDDCRFIDVEHPLWREDGSVIYLYNCFWALTEQSLSGRSRAELTAIFYCLIWDSPTWRARFPYLYPPGTGWPSYTPGHWVPFCRLLRLSELRWRYSNPPPHGCDKN
jgi:hypothetical protein